jgi:predicted RNase H-like HicB family nuclease
MHQPYYVHAEWDAHAQVWVATSESVPGLATEAATSEELLAKLRVMIPELLTANGVAHDAPVAFELLTRRFEFAA